VSKGKNIKKSLVTQKKFNKQKQREKRRKRRVRLKEAKVCFDTLRLLCPGGGFSLSIPQRGGTSATQEGDVFVAVVLLENW
jgi:hypothetical protein